MVNPSVRVLHTQIYLTSLTQNPKKESKEPDYNEDENQLEDKQEEETF